MAGGRLPWWGMCDNAATLEQSLCRTKAKHSSCSYLSAFAKESAIACVFLSNKLECTMPTGVSEQDTYALLSEAFDIPGVLTELPASPTRRWSTDYPSLPNSASAARTQLLQHLRALKYLCYDCQPGKQPLTPEMVKTTHKLLMSGATSSDGTLVSAGDYRTTPAHSGAGRVYPNANGIEKSVTKILAAFNAGLNSGKPWEVAAQLMYDIVALHPFEDGNGRLCHLLTAYALMASGEPFAVPLHNGHRNCRKHYEKVILHADRCHHTSQLSSFILECLVHKWCNLATSVAILE
jgi:fido (protein-threonine AMPylation protein)